MNPRVWALDLEMNKPSNKIIQIGLVIGDLSKDRILLSKNWVINPHETLDDFIIGLTGITQAQVDNGVELLEATNELTALIKQYKACKSPIVWGNGDLRTLKAQAGHSDLAGIHREIDIKTIHQFMCLSKSKSMRGGLETSMETYGMKFKGTPHDAENDAVNTFLLAVKFKALLCQIS